MKLAYNDRQHAYWLDGKRCKGVTSVAKIPDDTWALETWNKRMVAIGMALNAPLVQRAQAHFDERDQMDDIAEEALVAAKAHEASGRGTAIHRETERVDLGLEWIDTPETRAIRAAWARALKSAGLEVDSNYVERFVVYPDQYVAGQFDRLCRRTSDGALVVVDLKTGPNAVKYPHSTVCQLALYANAPLLAGPLQRRGKNEETTEFAPMPDGIDKTTGYVVYLPADGTPGQVYELNIAAGWQTVTSICFPTITWRKSNGLARPLEILVAPEPATPERVAWITARIRTINSAGHIGDVAGAWPTGVPTLKQGGLTDQHIDQIAHLLDQVETRYQLPFGPTDPLFAGLSTADQEPEIRSNPAPVVDTKAKARGWTDKAKALLAEFDDHEASAIARLVVPDGVDTTEQHYQWITAVIDELARPDGAVILTYSTLGPSIETADPADRILAVCGSKSAALLRAKRLAKELGQPNPRAFDHICNNPALAALTAAGLGVAEHETPTSKEELK